jgi:hypothetical protein
MQVQMEKSDRAFGNGISREEEKTAKVEEHKCGQMVGS